ncbi:MAG TPA: HEPN domain-containing protein [Azospirillum sp.]
MADTVVADTVAAWLRQSAHDLGHAGAAMAAGTHDWACLAAVHAAEKAIKAVLLAHGGRVLGSQNLLMLLERIRNETGAAVDDTLADDARTLMQALAVLAGQCTYSGIAPYELTTRAQADGALSAARRLHAHFAALTAAPTAEA